MQHFECMSTIENISRLEKDVLTLAEKFGATDKTSRHVLLVLEEILTNIRLHAYKKEPGLIEISASLCDADIHLLHLEITDWGPPFNPLVDSAAPDLESDIDDRPVGGLGIHIVRNLTHALSYVRLDAAHADALAPLSGGNRLCLSIPLG
ncbi:hypothetical protein AGMMS49960_07730 [Betaproteobacteria bacterium]|nr:hypothetical protein AGMMS49543_06170 [Betaproteobacteria bacterium]GHU00214.1 hypothetical protein AGMMS49960_07730 [Betaproteobacteria bacterium]GHU23649.1 hypothetical protein AGMMS50243_25450 [Betaproteobacteria bacterium]